MDIEKDFDGWSKVKKQTDTDKRELYCHPREVWRCRLGVNVGFEQDGGVEGYKRPVLVLRSFGQVCIVVPLTTSHKRNTFYIDAGIVDDRQAAAIISQIRLIDVRRLIERVGMLDVQRFATIRKATRDLL